MIRFLNIGVIVMYKKLSILSIINWIGVYSITCHKIAIDLNSYIVNGQVGFWEIFRSALFYEENHHLFLSYFLLFLPLGVVLNIILFFFIKKEN